MTNTVLNHISNALVFAQRKGYDQKPDTVENEMYLALKMAKARIESLERNMAFGSETRATMAASLMPRMTTSMGMHPFDIERAADHAVRATDALIGRLTHGS